MQGQANHFYRYAPTKIDYAIDRYHTETKRLYQVLNDRLQGQDGGWLVGGKFSVADLCCFSWVNWAEWAGVPTKTFPAVQKWYGPPLFRYPVLSLLRGCNEGFWSYAIE